MAVVYAKKTCAVGRVVLRRGQAWDSDAEIVRENPHLFEAEPAKVQGRVRGVERATAAPGEKRALGRPKSAD